MADPTKKTLAETNLHRSEIPDEPSVEDMEPWRDRIDEIDRTLVRLLNERAVCASTIGAIKKKLGMPVYVPSREEEVIENVTGCNAGPLENSAVRRLYERIIDETRALERHLYQQQSEKKE